VVRWYTGHCGWPSVRQLHVLVETDLPYVEVEGTVGVCMSGINANLFTMVAAGYGLMP